MVNIGAFVKRYGFVISFSSIFLMYVIVLIVLKYCLDVGFLRFLRKNKMRLLHAGIP